MDMGNFIEKTNFRNEVYFFGFSIFFREVKGHFHK
jgi:hypothetical protein